MGSDDLLWQRQQRSLRRAAPGTLGGRVESPGRMSIRKPQLEKMGSSPSIDSGGAGALLAYTEYDPAVLAALSATSSSSFADVDATNLAITFTAPASGRVLVVLSASQQGGTAGTQVYWNLRTTAPADVADSDMSMNYGNNHIRRNTYRKRFTGLTPSSSYTWRWGHRGAGGTTYIYAGGDHGAAVMEIWSA